MSSQDKFKELITAIHCAVDHLLDCDTKIPSDIKDPAALIAALGPCPQCGIQIDSSLCGLELKTEFEERLLTEVLRASVPPRFQPVVRAMMVHLDRCGVAA